VQCGADGSGSRLFLLLRKGFEPNTVTVPTDPLHSSPALPSYDLDRMVVNADDRKIARVNDAIDVEGDLMKGKISENSGEVYYIENGQIHLVSRSPSPTDNKR
jgi:hypothetical protein